MLAVAPALAGVVEDSGVKGGLVVHLGCGDGKLTAALRVNDSYLVGSHLNDINVFSPIFFDGELVGFGATIGAQRQTSDAPLYQAPELFGADLKGRLDHRIDERLRSGE